METPTRPPLDEATFAEAEASVRDVPFRVSVPVPLENDFEAYRAATFARLVGPGTPLVFGLVVTIAFASVAIFPMEPEGFDRKVWMLGEGVTAIAAAFGLIAVRVPRILARYSFVVSIVSACVFGAKVFEVIAYESVDLARYAMTSAIIASFLVALAFRLPPRLSVASHVAGAVGALLVALLVGARIDGADIPYSVFSSSTVALVVAHFVERQDRIAYLTTVLLQRETERSRSLNAELERLAKTDSLTGLANRRRFDEALAAEWERARREDTALALVIFDVDHFKPFNDAYGHPAGDACLARVAGAIRAAARRPMDLAARHGGEEFALLLPSTDSAGATSVAEQVLEAVDGLAVLHEHSPSGKHVTLSAGVAAARPRRGASIDALVAEADARLYRAKAEGRRRAIGGPDL